MMDLTQREIEIILEVLEYVQGQTCPYFEDQQDVDALESIEAKLANAQH